MLFISLYIILFHSLLPLGLGMTAIVSISVGGIVILLIFLVLIVVICWFKARNQRMASSIALGAGSPSTKKKQTTPVHEPHRGESSSPGSEHHDMYTIEPGATGSPLPYSLRTSTSNMNEQYSEEPRAAGSPSPPPVTDPATSCSKVTPAIMSLLEHSQLVHSEPFNSF